MAEAGAAAGAAPGSGGWDGADARRAPEDRQLTEPCRDRLASPPATRAARDTRFPPQPAGQRRNRPRPVRSVSPGKLSRRPHRARHRALGYHDPQDSLRSLHLHSRTEGTERVYISPLACFSFGKDYLYNSRLDELFTKPSCLPKQWHAQQLSAPSYSDISADIATPQECFHTARRTGDHQPNLDLGGHKHRPLINKWWGPLNTHAHGTQLRHS